MGKMFSKFSNNNVRFSNNSVKYVKYGTNNNNKMNSRTANDVGDGDRIIYTEDGTILQLDNSLFNIIKIFF